MTDATCVPVLDQPVERFEQALDRAVEVVAGIRPEQAGLPTPCDEFDVAHLVGHLVFAIGRAELLGLDEDPFGPGAAEASEVVPAPWAPAVREAADKALSAWRAADLDSPRSLPWLSGPAGSALASYVMEVVAHTWDLARATGQPVEGDPELGAEVLAMAEPFMAVAGPMAYDMDTPPFRRPTTAPDGAGTHTRIAAVLGREM